MIEFIYDLYKKLGKISTDTRNISGGSIFFALKGENFDGNSFAEKALSEGASYAIIDDSAYKNGDSYILVDNVLETLQKLALHHRKQLMIPVIGITGTNGKTTTKELIYAVLSEKYKCAATKGNLNNHIGVPLTLLSISQETEIAIIEMGANHLHEIEQLCRIALPDFGIITNIGKAHLEGFGSFEGVVKAKTELYAFISQNKGYIFVNADDPLLMDLSVSCNRILYGQNIIADCRGEILPSPSYLKFSFTNHSGTLEVDTQIIGGYNFENAMAAICIGRYFDVSPQLCKKALENYTPSNSRSQLLETQANRLIVDSYNANPSSMKAAIENFDRLQAPHKMVFLGGMRELGAFSSKEHEDIFDLTMEKDFEKVIFVGEEFAFAAGNPSVLWFPSSDETALYFKNHPVHDALILIKGSRGIAMEKIIGCL